MALMSLPLSLSETFNGQLQTGRQLMAKSRRRPRRGAFSTASPAFDRLLAGGLERGALVELVGRASSGRFSHVLALLAAVTSTGEGAALIDLGDSLDPRAAATGGIDLRRLLWVRPEHMKTALASAETILESGLPLLVIDLGLPPLRGGRGAEAAWLRLARRAQARGVALLVSSPYRVSGTAAHTVLETRRERLNWQGWQSRTLLLSGFGSRIERLKGPRLRPGESAAFALRMAASPTPASATESASTVSRPEIDGRRRILHLPTTQAQPPAAHRAIA